MTITEEFYRELSDKVYWLDPKHSKYEPDLKINSEWDFAGVEFKILKIKNSFDGMQAMAVAPIVHSKLEKNFKNKKIPANFRVLK
ncbi:hypothetical protein [Enterococcus faecium]|uniref:hypothetical protein n=1 Tax=Enterococcus faecium TaxID=1352 RepID=UPI0008139E79|nr:hypothetical protein [Enterococcus faecium]EGP5214774.1 hypothetical protein [Enterococcus faecium]